MYMTHMDNGMRLISLPIALMYSKVWLYSYSNAYKCSILCGMIDTVGNFLQDFGTPSRSATHTFTITIVAVPAKVPIFLHMERYHFLTPEVPDGSPAIDCVRTVS